MKIIKFNSLISNCLLFCLALKLKYRSKVRIKKTVGLIENFRKNKVLCSHFYIEHKNYKWHFTTDKNLKFPMYYLLFRGYIKIYNR